MRSLILMLSALVLSAAPAWCDQEQHQHSLTEEEVGLVHFANSCARTEATSFNRSVALLHSFQYEHARMAFTEISSHDPKCAMAQWGIAMSHYHGLWHNGDTAAGRVALQRAEGIAGANPQTTAREKAYIDALAEIYREDGQDEYSHAQAFEKKMGDVQAAYPDDVDAAIFHAVSLKFTAPKTDKTFANERKCGEILEPLLAKQPHHPGIAHYIIHCYDNPALAEQGLNAARVYAKIAPASAHANHMPSHIFTRVGLWDESISSNIKSAELAAQDERTSTSGEARDQRIHAMDYLEYAYLQSGRVKQAKALLDEMTSLPPSSGLTLTGNYGMAAIPARYAVELGKWQEAAQLQPLQDGVPWAQAISWMAIGVGSARSGNVGRATQAVLTLGSLRDAATKLNNTYWASQIEVQRREVSAWIAEKKGKTDDALAMMRSAAGLEESMDKDAVTPGAVTPAREMLAELLLLEKEPQDALTEYEAVLKAAPNRFNALFGAATAGDTAGNASVANQFFQKLTEIAVGDERPELITARKKLVAMSQSPNQ